MNKAQESKQRSTNWRKTHLGDMQQQPHRWPGFDKCVETKLRLDVYIRPWLPAWSFLRRIHTSRGSERFKRLQSTADSNSNATIINAGESSRDKAREFDALLRLWNRFSVQRHPPPSPLFARRNKPRLEIEFAWTHANCHSKRLLDSCITCVAVDVNTKAYAAMKLIYI